MGIMILFYCILALECFARVHTQELYNMRKYVDYDTGITSKLREESLELSLHETEFQLKTLQEKELERILHEKELQKTLQEKESKIQRLETEMTAFAANYTDDFLQSVCSVHPSAVFAHPLHCQLYYNCSHSHDNFLKAEVPYRSVYLSECEYPSVFSTETLECESYTTTECDKRILHKWQCGYFYYILMLSMFTCTRLYPNCEGKPDGVWPNTAYHSEGWSGLVYYYMVCKDERVVRGGSCAYDKIWFTGGGYKYLHNQQCKSKFEIPIEDGGYLPSCNATKDGNYPFPGTCEGYYRCAIGISYAVKCPTSTGYDSTLKVCTQFYNSNCQYIGKK